MKIIYIIALIFISIQLSAQITATQIDSAKNVLDSVELKYSNRHIKYADAALGLALLYYQSDSTSTEKEQLSLQALSLYRKLKGIDSEAYLNALRSLPYRKAQLFNLQLNLWDAARRFGKQSESYGSELFNLGLFYLGNKAQEGHDSCLYALQIVEKNTPKEKFDSYIKQLSQNYPKIASLIIVQLKLESHINRNFENIAALIEGATPNTDLYAEALLAVSEAIVKYRMEALANVQLYSAYEGFKKCLEYYEKSVNIESIAYKTVWKAMSPEMQLFYKLETAYLDALKRHETNSEDFLKLFKAFLREVGDATAAGGFSLYNVQDIFHAVELDLEKYHGGTNSPIYVKIREMSDVWTANAFSLSIEYQKQNLVEVKDKYGANSRPYAETLFDYSLFQIDYYDYDEAIDNLVRAMQLFKELDATREPAFPADSLLYTQYLKQLPNNWSVFVENEIRVSELMLGASRPTETSLALLQAAEVYLSEGILDLRAYDYCKQAMGMDSLLQTVTASPSIDILKRLLAQYPTELPFVLRNTFVTFYSITAVKNLLAPPMLALNSQNDPDSLAYYDLQSILADVYYHNDTVTDTEWLAYRLYEKILERFDNVEGLSANYEALLRRIIAQIRQENRWSIEMAETFFERYLKLLSQRDGVGQSVYRTALLEYADWLYENDQYTAAEPFYKQLGDKLTENFGQKQASLGKVYYNLARIYRKTGRYQASVSTYKSAIAQAVHFNDYLLVIQCLDDVGLVMYELEYYEQAIDFFKSCLDYIKIFEDIGELNFRTQKEDAMIYTKVLRHLARVYLAAADLELAEATFKSVEAFITNSKLLDIEKDYSLQADLAVLYDKLQKDEIALSLYQKAINNLNDKGELAESYQNLGNFYLRVQKEALAAKAFEKGLRIDLQQLEENYRNLPEASRLLFLESIEKRIQNFMRYVIEHADTSLYQLLFDTHLKIKGLALETTTNIKNVVSASENVRLKELYNEMQLLRKKITDATLLSPTEIERKGIDLVKFNIAIREKEEEITRFSQDLRRYFDRENRQLDFEQLKKILPENAAAIDFLTIESQNSRGYSENIYYALLTTKKSAIPKIIKLCTESRLQSVLEPEINASGSNYITDDFESRYLYELIWEPIEPSLRGIKEIHLCPNGLLCKVAFATLQNTLDARQRLMDKYSIHYHTAMRDLLRQEAVDADSIHRSITLVGGVHFSLDRADIIQIAKARRLNPRTVALLSAIERGIPIASGFDPGVMSSEFAYLPGTLKEVQTIAPLFEAAGWAVHRLIRANALEEEVTALSEKNPAILHIATHGFFFPIPHKKEVDVGGIMPSTSNFEMHLSHLENPLLRSGLALTGINRVWKGGKPLEELADGILTAYEVAGMNLFDTELVVLSACETGRGDIDNNEGILGLQRAFKTAGAKKLLLSLWKVPDAQTAELMLLFYQFYLSGKTVHQAFEKAQQEMRIRYKNPYYWAAFILVE